VPQNNLRFYNIEPQRKKRRKAVISSILFLLLAIVSLVGASQLQVVREFFGQASGAEASFVVDSQAVLGSLPRPWRNLAQGGEDHNWRIGSLTKQVSALHPEYIRLDHIYDFYDIVQGNPGNLSMNWEKFDLVLDDILATGAKPYISLSYMPPAISSGDILAPPQNWSDWQWVVKQTIQHISGERGISDVYYEVWNEPDLFGGYKYYGDKNYLNLYAAASDASKQVGNVRPFKLGGPATTALYESWFRAWADACVKNDWRCDFFSWHRYTTDVDQYIKDMALVRAWAQDYPQLANLEFQITEWGHDSENNAGYDSSYAAAHTVAASIEMMNSVERAFVFEIQDGKDPQGQAAWGRWGMFRHSDFGAQAKPRYYALLMLDSLPSRRLQIVGNGTWVKGLASKADDGSIILILANFDPKGKHSENVPLEIDRLPVGTYVFNKEYLSGRKQTEELATDESGVLTTQVFMSSNDVVKLTLQQKL
jgi:hypothetical protein